ncbi:hypothetical protein AB1Y20_004076 [Prymnesium parvum]|uniref:JmjC domain-containing protein n=1 Tax=Prymnesium parvum TaxID=97485 RepID=A0AB34J842_PRYPA
MDPFDVFDAAPAIAPQAAADDLARVPPTRPRLLQPRASTHPHFTASLGVWPATPPRHSAAASRERFHALMPRRVDACVRGLRGSASSYAASCARALRDASTALAAGDENGAAASSRVAAEFCSLQLDESNWDSPWWQESYLLALAFLLSGLLVADATHDGGEGCEAVGRTAVQLFNLAVTMSTSSEGAEGGGEARWQWLGELLHAAEAAVAAAHPLCAPPRPVWRMPTELCAARRPDLKGRRVLEVDHSDLSCAAFYTDFLQRGVPVLIRGYLHAEEWAALDYFQDLERLYSDHGARLVPVNLGSPLVGYKGMVHWPLGKLIERSLLPSIETEATPPHGAADEEGACEVAYMSQHHLLHQVPSLQQLLALPQYTVGRELSPANLWLGSRGTVTSLHSDPSDNLLCQERTVAGFKYFRLYALDQTPKLYATTLRSKSKNTFGTSPVRVEAPSEEYPDFLSAEYEEGLLEPGDMLFIPKSHWHYVRALSTSCSINVWFD